MTSFRMLSLAGFLLAVSPAVASEMDGVWARGDGNVRIRIAPCGGQVCATNIAVRDTSNGEAVGDRLVMSLKQQGSGVFEGSAYDVKRKLNVSMTVKVSANAMTSRGCVIGKVLCREASWSR